MNYYDWDGNPIDQVEAWAVRFERGDNHVDDTTIVCGDESVRVSTVWLGLDHSFGNGPPLIFETMVFGGPVDEWGDRYPTAEAAQAGHDRIVAALKAGDLTLFGVSAEIVEAGR